jgi:Co/Zn/Cd efflux system component
MLVANACYARSDAASSLVVGLGIVGNLAGHPFRDPVAALVVGGMVLKMGWSSGWEALHDLMDQAADDLQVGAIRATILAVPRIWAGRTSPIQPDLQDCPRLHPASRHLSIAARKPNRTRPSNLQAFSPRPLAHRRADQICPADVRCAILPA